MWDLYRTWYHQTFDKSSTGLGRNKYLQELRDVIDSQPALAYTYVVTPGDPKGRKWKTSKYMRGPEPLIVEFGLDHYGSAWWNEHYSGRDRERRSTPTGLKQVYRGLIRKKYANDPEPQGDDDECDG